MHYYQQHTNRISTSLLLLCNVALTLGIIVFAIGFFPYKPFLPGVADWENGQIPETAPFDKIIFMVVDALRSDFVYSNTTGFQNLQELIRQGNAVPFTAHAASPTITMPKVKAITTGSVPSFLDVILNFAESDKSSTLTNQDTWPSQLQRKPDGKHLVMYGDDTWLKLFPDLFVRADGTSSFFVSDFTEVDHNVTRHIATELENDDWNAMIMHYLGLDHIGHKSGPRSPHMLPKQREMDAIVAQIYSAMVKKPHLSSTLLVLCGDHGMNDAGNHGGSSEGETSPALVFLSPKLTTVSRSLESPSYPHDGEYGFYDIVEQSDIAPTLAGLLGIPIPLNNLGVFIPRMLDLWPKDESRAALLYRNALQMSNIIGVAFQDRPLLDEFGGQDCESLVDESLVLWCLWKQSEQSYLSTDHAYGDKLAGLIKFLRRAQIIMSQTATDYGIYQMQYGIGLAALSMVCALCATSLLCTISGMLAFSVCALALTNGIMMFASSFVEEEQHFWYWATSAWLAGLHTRSLARNVREKYHAWYGLALMMLFRILRRWNQTGQKHAGEADIGGTFLSQHTSILWFLVAATIADSCRKWSLYGLPGAPLPLTITSACMICSACLLFKLCFTLADDPELLLVFPETWITCLGVTWLIHQARAIYAGLIATLVFTFSAAVRGILSPHSTAQSLHVVMTIFLVTLTRVNNIPVFLLFTLILQCIRALRLHPRELTITSVLLQYASYFALGGSNSISSVDLSNAYNGISGYNVGAVGILTFFSNWAGPIWWAMSTIVILLEESPKSSTALARHLCLLSLFAATNVVFVMVACTMLRTHLFIWTVFSPKYLFTMAWTLAQHVGINLVLGSLFYWICS